MYGEIQMLTNRALHERYKEAHMAGKEARMREALFEMARRVGTSGAMLLDDYRENQSFRCHVDNETELLFGKYKLNGGQDDRW